MRKNNYDYVLQENMFDCGVAALKTIFLQYGKRIKTEDIVTKKINQGLTALELINASKKLGIDAKGVKSDIDNFDFNYLPCIAHTIKDKNFYHYIVILEQKKNKKSFVVMDPATGIEEITNEELKEISTNIFIIFNSKKLKKEQDKRFKNLIFNILLKNKKTVIYTLLLSLFIIVLSLVFNYFVTIILKYNFNYKYILIISLLFLFISILKNLIDFIREKIIIKLNSNIDKEINKTVINHILNLPYQYYCNKSVGESIILMNDIEIVKNIITKIFIIFLIDFSIILFILVFITFYSWYYLLIFIIFILLTTIVSLNYQNIFNEQFIKSKKNKIGYNSYLIEIFNSYNSIKNLKLENKVIKKTENKYKEVIESEQKYNKNNNIYKYINNNIVEIFFVIFIFIVACISLKSNNYFNIVLFSSLFYLFIGFLNNINESIVTFAVYKSSINKLLDTIELKKEKQNIKNISFNKIIFENISFKYDDKEILNNISFEINKKDKILLYGDSGSGKTTIVKLLLKYIKYNKGSIFFDNLNQKYLESSRIRNSISYISQEETLFNDTIYNNLKIVNDNKKEIKKVMDLCMIDINQKYVLEENGSNISGGERKKILIARGLLRNSNLIIFDESFNEIDDNTERIILQNIMNNYKDLTIIMITHQRNNMFLFNRCFELKNKKIKEEKNEEFK